VYTKNALCKGLTSPAVSVLIASLSQSLDQFAVDAGLVDISAPIATVEVYPLISRESLDAGPSPRNSGCLCVLHKVSLGRLKNKRQGNGHRIIMEPTSLDMINDQPRAPALILELANISRPSATAFRTVATAGKVISAGRALRGHELAKITSEVACWAQKRFAVRYNSPVVSLRELWAL